MREIGLAPVAADLILPAAGDDVVPSTSRAMYAP